MRYLVIMVMITLLLTSAIPFAYANTRQENNANIAEFILDTIKLPLVLVGAFTKQDHQKVKEEVDYKEHKGLRRALR